MTIEYAAAGDRHVRAVMERAPPHVRAAINRARVRSGLRPIALPEPPAGGDRWATSVCWDPDSPRRPTRGPGLVTPSSRAGRGPLIDRVLLVVAHGDAPGRSIGRGLPESIARDAFGPADVLNRERGWGIVSPGHGGPYVAFGGPRLRAIDSEVGLVLAWDLDRTDARHREAAELIEKGWSCSAFMRVDQRRKLPGPIEVVTRARLINVALVDRPAYAGAVAMLFRSSWRDDPGQARDQLAAVIREARFRERRRWGRAV